MERRKQGLVLSGSLSCFVLFSTTAYSHPTYIQHGRVVGQVNSASAGDGQHARSDDDAEERRRRERFFLRASQRPRKLRNRSASLSSTSRTAEIEGDGVSVLTSPKIQARYKHLFARSTDADENNSSESSASATQSRIQESPELDHNPSKRRSSVSAPSSPPVRARRNSTSALPDSSRSEARSANANTTEIGPREWLSRIENAAKSESRVQVRRVIAAYRESSPGALIAHNAALRALLKTRERDGTVDEILEVYNDMLDRGMRLDTSSYETIIEALCQREREVHHLVGLRSKKRGRFEEIASASLWVQPGFREQYPELATRDDVWSRVLAVNEPVEEIGIPDDYFPSIEKMFRALGNLSQKLSPTALNQLLAVTATRPNKIDLAIAVFGALEASQTLTPLSYLHLIGSYAKVGDLQGARTVFDAYVEARKARPWHHAALETIDEIGAGARSLSSKLPSSHEAVWNRMIETSIIHGDAESALALVEQMVPSDRANEIPRMSVETLETVVNSFIKIGDEDSALRWFDRIMAEVAKGRTSTFPLPRAAFFSNIISQSIERDLDSFANHVFIASLNLAPGWDSPALKNRSALDLSRLIDRHISKAIILPVSAAVAVQSLNSIRKLREEVSKKVTAKEPRHPLGRPHFTQVRRLIGALALHGQYEEASAVYQELVSALAHRPELDYNMELKVNLFEITPLVALGVAYPPVGPAAKPSLSASLGVASAIRGAGQRAQSAVAALVVESYLSHRGQEGGFDQTSWASLVDAFALISADIAKGARFGFEFPGFQVVVDDLLASGVSLEGSDLRQAAISLVEAVGPQQASASFRSIDSRLADLISSELSPPLQPTPTSDPAQYVFSQSPSPSLSKSVEEDASASASSSDPTTPGTPPDYISHMQPAVVPGRVDGALSRQIGLPSADERIDSTVRQVFEAAKDGRLAHPASISRLIEKVARNPAPANDALGQIYNLYTLGYSSLSLINDAQDQFDNWTMLEDRMIIALATLGDLEKVAVHRDRLLANGSAPTADSYGSMILNARETTDDAAVALELFLESRRLQVRPNVFLYNTLISKLSKARRAPLALEYFNEMKGLGLTPSAITYGSVINACCKTGDEATAVQLFDEMTRTVRNEIRVPPYNTMIQFFVSRGNREAALKYFDALVRTGVKPTEHTYKLLLDAYGTIEPVDTGYMMQVFDELVQNRNLKVSGAHWASLFYAWGCVKKDVDRVIALFESIPTHRSTRSARVPLPDALVYEALFNVFVENDRYDLVDTYMRQMKERGVRMTAYVANSLIRVRGIVVVIFALLSDN
jgi:pentatricopeptide repeat protein